MPSLSLLLPASCNPLTLVLPCESVERMRLVYPELEQPVLHLPRSGQPSLSRGVFRLPRLIAQAPLPDLVAQRALQEVFEGGMRGILLLFFLSAEPHDCFDHPGALSPHRTACPECGARHLPGGRLHLPLL